MDNFKKYNIEKDITLQSKVENDRLFVFYEDKWVQLSCKKNPEQFYGFLTIRRLYGIKLCHEIGLTEMNKKYNRKILSKKKRSILQSIKEILHKKESNGKILVLNVLARGFFFFFFFFFFWFRKTKY